MRGGGDYGGAIVSADTGLAPAGTYDCDHLPGGWACDERPWAPYSLNGCAAYTLETDRAFAVDRTGDADLFPSAYYLDPFLQAVDASVVDPLPAAASAAAELNVVQLLHGCCVHFNGHTSDSRYHYLVRAVYAEDDNGTRLATGLVHGVMNPYPYLCHDPTPSGSNATYNLTLLYSRTSSWMFDEEPVPALAATTWTNRNYRCADARPSKLALVADPHWPEGTEGTEGTGGQLLQTEIAAGVPVTVTLSADADTAGIEACFGLNGTLQRVSYWDDFFAGEMMDLDDYYALTACDSYVYLRSCDASKCAGRDTDIATACNFTTIAAFEDYLDEPAVTFPHGNAYSCSPMARDASRGAGPFNPLQFSSAFSYARLVPPTPAPSAPPPTPPPTPTPAPTPTAAPSASGLSPGAITGIAVGAWRRPGNGGGAAAAAASARARLPWNYCFNTPKHVNQDSGPRRSVVSLYVPQPAAQQKNGRRRGVGRRRPHRNRAQRGARPPQRRATPGARSHARRRTKAAHRWLYECAQTGERGHEGNA